MHIGKLRETIAALYRITGQEFAENDELGITDAIRLAFKTAPGQKMTALDVRGRLEQLGFDLSGYRNVLASIHTVLKRLEEKREISRIDTVGGKAAYAWMPRLGFHPFQRARTVRKGKPPSTVLMCGTKSKLHREPDRPVK
jgi:hypothetical protein